MIQIIIITYMSSIINNYLININNKILGGGGLMPFVHLLTLYFINYKIFMRLSSHKPKDSQPKTYELNLPYSSPLFPSFLWVFIYFSCMDPTLIKVILRNFIGGAFTVSCA